MNEDDLIKTAERLKDYAGELKELAGQLEKEANWLFEQITRETQLTEE